MDWNLALQAVQAAAVLFGVAFGVIQVRQFRAEKEHQATIQLLQSMQDPNMAPSILALYKLPDGLDADELAAKLGSKFDGVMALAAMFDSLGPLVARGHVPLSIYVDFYRGATVVCWRKLRRYIETERKAGWGNLYEWLQWLAERMDEIAPQSTDVPAFERFRAWKGSDDYSELCARNLSR